LSFLKSWEAKKSKLRQCIDCIFYLPVTSFGACDIAGRRRFFNISWLRSHLHEGCRMATMLCSAPHF